MEVISGLKVSEAHDERSQYLCKAYLILGKNYGIRFSEKYTLSYLKHHIFGDFITVVNI